jgi:prenyltransferase beta subunit
VGLILRALACAAAALALAGPAVGASPASPVERAAAYLEAHQQQSGGFGEPGRAPSAGLTAWAVLGLAAAGHPPAGAAEYLAGEPYPSATDLALRILALAALGRDTAGLATRLEGLRRTGGAIGPAVNSTVWGVIALRAAGRDVPEPAIRYLLASQSPGGGWSWARGLRPDADDTAAAIQALRAAGERSRSRPILHGLAFLRGLQNGDGGFEAEAGRGSNAQSTAWAMQAFLAAGKSPGKAAFAYLERLQRGDGSFGYGSTADPTPVWVTSQAIAALARRPFPLS